jgi:hypothetical protein
MDDTIDATYKRISEIPVNMYMYRLGPLNKIYVIAYYSAIIGDIDTLDYLLANHSKDMITIDVPEFMR